MYRALLGRVCCTRVHAAVVEVCCCPLHCELEAKLKQVVGDVVQYWTVRVPMVFPNMW